MESVLSQTDTDIPESLKDKDVTKAFYGIVREALTDKIEEKKQAQIIAAEVALEADKIIQTLVKVDWSTPGNISIQRKMIHLIGDHLIDEVRDKYQIVLSFNEIDNIAEQIVDVAKIRYK